MPKRIEQTRRRIQASALPSGWLWFGVSACTGIIGSVGNNGSHTTGGPGSTGSGTMTGGTGTGTTGTGTGGGGSVGFACPANTIEPGPSAMRLLTPEQYLNTVRDLLGDVPNMASVFDANSISGALGLVQADIAQVDLERFQNGAELAASAIAINATKIKALAPCATGADKRGCARTFVQTFGSLSYRAPLTDAMDIDRHLALYDAGATTSFEHGIEMILRG